jgi:hypothetical protein
MQTELQKPDFFSITGVGMKIGEQNKIKVCGHNMMHTFDLESRRFEDTTLI